MRLDRVPYYAWLAAILALPAPVRGEGGFSPDEARARMKLPDGFRVEVFASEPMVRQPVAGCFDERGRIWVIEYLQYPTPAGLKPVTVDQYLRTEYDRVPEPPPRGVRGADRIKILEDTDGDGRADKVTIFAEGLNLATGICVGHGGVFVGQAPYLLFYPDRDRDDRPDGDPEVLLKGFGLQDAHATVNSMAWGPDGWLYGAQGSTVTADIRGFSFQQGIWRYHPLTRDFELFAEGGGNTWGLDFDAVGNAFGSSNGAFIAFHMVQGGYYWKGFAKHGPLHNPRTYGYFDSIAYEGSKQGGHVTPGGIIYKEDQFPAEFRGAFIGGNLLSNAVYWHPLKARGSTFSGKHGGSLIEANDQWFRPIDLFTGPDGSVYVVDWYDKRASHLDPRDNWDKTNGRIFKVSYGQGRTVAPFDLLKNTSAELVAMQADPADWRAAQARRILAERRDASLIPDLTARLKGERDEVLAARWLWAVNACGGSSDELALQLLDHPAASVRRWSIRLMGDSGRCPAAFRDRLAGLVDSESDPGVIAQVASSCQRWGGSDSEPILSALLRRDFGRDDPYIPLLTWWAIEKQLRFHPDRVVALVAHAIEGGNGPLAREAVLERLCRALIVSEAPEDERRLVSLASVASKEGLPAVLAGLEKALEGGGRAEQSGTLSGWIGRVWEDAPHDPLLVRVAARLGHPEAVAEAGKVVADDSAPADRRLVMIGLLGELRREEGIDMLLRVARGDGAEPIRLAALRAAARSPDSGVASTLLGDYGKFPEGLRGAVLDACCDRPEWARLLLTALAGGTIPAKDLRDVQVRRMLGLNDPSLPPLIERAWGRIPSPSGSGAAKRIAEVRGMLPEGDKGQAARGRAIFARVCSGCHRLFGEGEEVGPDLTGSTRNDLEFLLQSVVDPSAFIRNEYQGSTVVLDDGRVLNGMIVAESDSALTLVDSQRERHTLAKATVEETRPATASVMPEGLLDPLPDNEIRDLFRYLQSPAPPAP